MTCRNAYFIANVGQKIDAFANCVSVSKNSNVSTSLVTFRVNYWRSAISLQRKYFIILWARVTVTLPLPRTLPYFQQTILLWWTQHLFLIYLQHLENWQVCVETDRLSVYFYISGLQRFLFDRPPSGTLLKNRPPRMTLVLANKLFWYENISMLMKYRDSLVSTKNEQTKRLQMQL